jgi:tetratricopeptide (TPR) repeat protein
MRIGTSADRWVRAILVVGVICGAGWVVQPWLFPTPLQAAIQSLSWDLAGRNFIAAQKAADRALALDPDSPAVLLLAGLAAAGRFDHDETRRLLERIPPESSQRHPAELGLAYQSLLCGEVVEAERLYRNVLAREPYQVEGNRRLGYLLQAEGRAWESTTWLSRLICLGNFNGDELLGVGSVDHFFFADLGLESSLASGAAPDPLIRLGEVRLKMGNGEESAILSVLRDIARRYPKLAEPQARLGRQIFDSQNREEFLAWNAGITPDLEQHPEIWFVRGLFARREGTLRTAVRSFIETLLRSPNHLAAHHQIAGCLSQLGAIDEAQEFSRRAALLSKVVTEINMMGRAPTGDAAQRLIELLSQLGRHWEAAGWAYISSRFDHPFAGWREAYFSEVRRLPWSGELTATANQPALRLDRSQFPVPDWPRTVRQQVPAETGRAAVSTQHWRFIDEARGRGIDFEYFEGTTPEHRLQHIFQAIGGGVGVLDYDRDGRPDLYFPQANDWRRPVAESTTPDRLFRNTCADRFIDVTAAAGLGDLEFSFGVTAGDYDNDGWADLYVGNLTANRLYHNNGDGTFADVSASSGTPGDEWSTSCALADLNGDGLSDLFVVRYSDRDYAIRNPCFTSGIETSCSPDMLPGTTARCYINQGNGRFSDVSREAGLLSSSGKGLGLVIADFTGRGRLNVFVGNDSSGNHYFQNRGADAGGVPHFDELAGILGLAMNADGNAQACMGIAAGDADGDGLLDLVVTNFMKEGSTLYAQQSDGSFIDATRRAKLREPTISRLGFGAQFLDVDGDGWEDLVTTNGHVSPPLTLGTGANSDKMPPQLFANQADGAFAEANPAELGPFFQRNALGRGLAVLDWNRDGRPDFCVSHIHSEVALESNATADYQHRLVVRLVGTEGARDAYGAVGRARVGQRQLTRHLAAGNGFQAVNEPFLWFGLGPAETVDELEITWPGGKSQRWQNLAGDRDILIIEGHPGPVTLNHWSDHESRDRAGGQAVRHAPESR